MQCVRSIAQPWGAAMLQACGLRAPSIAEIPNAPSPALTGDARCHLERTPEETTSTGS